MIKNVNGSPYKLKGKLSTYDPNSNQHSIFDKWDQEFIMFTGTPVYYYSIHVQLSGYDELYMEDRTKLFSPVPIKLWAFYEPPQQQSMSGIFSVDTPDEEIILELNRSAALTAIGHPPKVGSRIYTPHRGENWIVIDYKLDKFLLWGAIRLILHCKKFQETTTAADACITSPQPPPEFPITDFTTGTGLGTPSTNSGVSNVAQAPTGLNMAEQQIAAVNDI